MEECFYSYPETYPIYASRITCAIYGIYCPVIIIINVALIVSFFATKQWMQNTSNLLIVCLSISDCLIGVVVMPILVIDSLWFNTEKHCSIVPVSFSLQYLFGGISSNMTILLAIDRYIHMNPNILENESKFAKLFRRPRIHFLIFACCAFSITMSLSFYFLMQINPRITAYYNGALAILLLIDIDAHICDNVHTWVYSNSSFCSRKSSLSKQRRSRFKWKSWIPERIV